MLSLSLTLGRQTEKRDIIITQSNSGVNDKGKGEAGEQGAFDLSLGRTREILGETTGD